MAALKSTVSRSAVAARRPVRIVAQAAKPSSSSPKAAVAACSAALAAALVLGVAPVDARVIDVSEKTAAKEAEFQLALSKLERLVEKQRAEVKAATPATAPSPVAAVAQAPVEAPAAPVAAAPAVVIATLPSPAQE